MKIEEIRKMYNDQKLITEEQIRKVYNCCDALIEKLNKYFENK